MRCVKQDSTARRLYGPEYMMLPKSVLAVAAWYLADLASEKGAGNGQALARLAQEVATLAENDIIPKAQARRAVRELLTAAARERGQPA